MSNLNNKSLWIKVSAKCVNVNVISLMSLMLPHHKEGAWFVANRVLKQNKCVLTVLYMSLKKDHQYVFGRKTNNFHICEFSL